MQLYLRYSESTPVRAGVKRSCAALDEDEGLGEVVCTMNDVIMIEDGQCATGTVLKVGMVKCVIRNVHPFHWAEIFKDWSCL